MKLNNRQGFSLIETLLAMTIMAIAITGILSSFSASLVASQIGKDYAIADLLMGDLRGQLQANLLNPLEVNTGTFPNYPNFTWEATFYYTDTDNLYQVELKIQWKRGNKPYLVNHVTYFYSPPMEEKLQTES